VYRDTSADYDQPFYCNFTFGTGTDEPWVSTINLLARRKASPQQRHTEKFLAAELRRAPAKPHKLILGGPLHVGEQHTQTSLQQTTIAPRRVEYLYSGGNWNVNYTYSPVRFQPPNGTVKTELVTLITGHGTPPLRTTITHTDHPDDRFFIVGLNVRLNG
jgi:hypothetical protein